MKTNRVTGRPLFMFCALFFIFSMLLPYTVSAVKLFLIVFSAGALMLINIIPPAKRLSRLTRRSLSCGAAALGAACVVSVCFIDIPIKRAAEFDGLTLEAEITIEDEGSVSSYYGYYTAGIKSNEYRINEKVYLAIPDGSAVPGDVFTGTLTLSVPLSEDLAERYSEGIFLDAEAESVTYIRNERTFSITKLCSDINGMLSAKLSGVADDHGGLASAVLLGDRDRLELSVKRDFSRLGISHLLAVSGLHLSVIVSIIGFFLSKTKLSRGALCAVKAAMILAFMALTGFSPSVLRAGIMHLFAAAAAFLDRDGDSLTSLSAAAALIVIIDPVSVFDAGLLLSVLAAYACISYSMLSRDRGSASAVRPSRIRKVIKHVTETVKLTLFINAMTLPVMWCVFGEISLISPLTNVVFIPLVTVLLFLALIYLPLCGVPRLSSASAWSVAVLEDIITETAETVSHLPHITVSMRFGGIGLFAVLLFLSVIPMALVSNKLKKALGFASAVSTVCLAGCLSIGMYMAQASCQADLTVRGKNEGLVLRDGNIYTVVDISDGSSGLQYELTRVAKEARAVEIDTLMLTHYHMKHTYSLPLTADRMIIRRVMLPSPESNDDAEICEKLLSACAERDIETVLYERSSDSVLTDGGLTLDFHEYTRLSRSTHPVVSFAFTLGGRRYVYAGGSAGEGDEDILSEVKSADTVFFGAHPPVTKDTSGIKPHGNAVISEKAVSDALLTCTKEAQGVTVVKDRETYSTGAYKKR